LLACTAGYDSATVVAPLAAMVIGRVDEVDNPVMMSSAVSLIGLGHQRGLTAHLRRMTDPSPPVLIRDGISNGATLRSSFPTRRKPTLGAIPA
jgi:hypothetical protein